jgi:hypothetical protein
MTDIEKEFVLYPEALALKELGFDEPCISGYSTTTKQRYFYLRPTSTQDSFTVDNPTYSQAFRWFREKYGLDVTFRKMDYGPESQFTGYYFSVYKSNELIDIHGADTKCKVYEEAELACLQRLIEIVKSK